MQTEVWDDCTQIMRIERGRVHIVNLLDRSWDEQTVVTRTSRAPTKLTLATRMRRIWSTIVRGVS